MDLSQMSDEEVGNWGEATPEEDAGYRERRKREEWCKGLRQFANVIEQHPEIDIPFGTSDWGALQFFIMGKEQLAALVRAMPCKAEKRYDDHFLNMGFQLGEFCTNAYVTRASVCERIVTGTQEVVKRVPDPDAPMIEVRETVEVVSWHCDEPLLA